MLAAVVCLIISTHTVLLVVLMDLYSEIKQGQERKGGFSSLSFESTCSCVTVSNLNVKKTASEQTEVLASGGVAHTAAGERCTGTKCDCVT